MIEIVPKFSAKVADDDAAMARLEQPVAVAVVGAKHISKRIKRGKFATKPKPYSSKPSAGSKKAPKYYISPAYAESLGVPGQTVWESSAAFHKAIGAKPGNTSSQMIQNIGVRNNGTKGALIEFRGSSIGASSAKKAKRRRVRVNARYDAKTGAKLKAVYAKDARGKFVTNKVLDEQGKAVLNKTPVKVRNQVKASAVFRKLDVALLQLTPAEQAELLRGFAAVSSSITETILGFVPTRFGSGGALQVAITERLRK